MTWQIWLGIGCVTFLLFSVWRRGWHRTIIGMPNLEFEQLDLLLLEPEKVRRSDQSVPPADFSTQLRDDISSVIYHKSERGSLRETLDISVPTTAGMVLQFTAGHLVEFKRIGGATYRPPGLSREQIELANDLLERVRVLAA